MDRTLVICKPDAVERGLVGQIVSRLEAKGFTSVAAEFRTIDTATAAAHYAEHEGKGFYEDLVTFITRSPAMVLVVEGPTDTWKAVRLMMRSTNPMEAAPGTIRGDLGSLFTENLIHGSDSLESANREIGIFFRAWRDEPVPHVVSVSDPLETAVTWWLRWPLDSTAPTRPRAVVAFGVALRRTT